MADCLTPSARSDGPFCAQGRATQANIAASLALHAHSSRAATALRVPALTARHARQCSDTAAAVAAKVKSYTTARICTGLSAGGRSHGSTVHRGGAPLGHLLAVKGQRCQCATTCTAAFSGGGRRRLVARLRCHCIALSTGSICLRFLCVCCLRSQGQPGQNSQLGCASTNWFRAAINATARPVHSCGGL